ncbi:MAG: hypothetical protein E7365_02270 [Clostridiales bacterium]|nr:hypothetical protein [Clostridiales bacterium]
MKKFILLLTVCALFTGCGMMNDIKDDISPSPDNSPINSPLTSPLPDILPDTTDGLRPENTQAPDNATNNNNPNSALQ